MSEFGSCLAYLRDPRLAALATTPASAWLCSVDGARVLWSNPVGAAAFGAASLTDYAVDPHGAAVRELGRLAGTLRQDAPPRLERLRGFGGRLGRAVMCACSRLTLPDGVDAILIAATEPTEARLSLEQRIERLLTSCEQPIIAFAADGALLHAAATAAAAWPDVKNLAALAAPELVAVALAQGRANGPSKLGETVIERLGTGAATVLMVVATVPPVEVSTPRAAAEPPEAADASLMPPPERRKPLRFVWQMDADGRFSLNSEEFAALIGPQTEAALSQPWSEAAAALELDPQQQVARAIASRETWSGIEVGFPADGSELRVPVDLSGLPVFDRDRSFRGYRGFGICRDIARVAEIEALRRRPAAAAEPAIPRDEMPAPPTTPSHAKNVVPFRGLPPAEKPPPGLTPVERKAFTELANRLTARLRSDEDEPPATPPDDHQPPAVAAPPPTPQAPAPVSRTVIEATTPNQRSVLDRLPVGVLVYRLNRLIYANRAFLDWTGYGRLDALEEAGGLDALFIEPTGGAPRENNGAKLLTIATSQGGQMPVEARLFTAPWDGESALVLMFASAGGAATAPPVASDAPPTDVRSDAAELSSILDSVTDGVLVLDRDARVISLNRSAESLFGYDGRELVGLPVGSLFAPESERAVVNYLASLGRRGAAAREDGREVIGRVRSGGLVPLFMTVGHIADGSDKLVAVFRDITPWKKVEADLVNARRQAERASSAKSEFLAKVSHEIRTPLNAIIGFSEVMTEERFGPIGNERYAQYLKDIRISGEHLVSLLNDLLDLSKIEAGKLDLNFTNVDLNELTQQCVALMQPQANRERVIIRTSLSANVQTVVADARSVRQIVLNLLSNSIKFTRAGGQIIVSTASNDIGEVVLRVRDTGIGMSEKEIAIALEPFRQLATSARWGSGGTGLGLPLTKALAEANRATFSIKSAVNAGTLVEVAFPGARLAAE